MRLWDGVKEGWGITLDPKGRTLYVSDGTSKITRINADTVSKDSAFHVKTLSGQQQNMINEL